jgi:hypothetical protein
MSLTADEPVEGAEGAAEAKEAAEKKPVDPRRAKPVLRALALAGRRDPSPDPLKPIGRGALFIWIAIVATFLFAFPRVNPVLYARYINDVAPVAQFFDKDLGERSMVGAYAQNISAFGLYVVEPLRKVMERGLRFDANSAILVFGAGTLMFAVYYSAIYLIVANTRRGAVRLSIMAYRHVLRPAWRTAARAARRIAKLATERRGRGERVTQAGVEPQLH